MTNPGNGRALAAGVSVQKIRVKQELREQCSELRDLLARTEQESSRVSVLAELLFLHNQVLQEQLKQERVRRRQLERDFEKMGSEDFGRLVEPFLTKGMFAKHAKR